MTFRNGDGFNDPHWVLPTYTAQVLERRVDAHGPPWIYNTWEPFERDINHDMVMGLIDAAGAMGIDVFTIDDGWQQDYGENTVNLTAFPGGLKPIQDAVEAQVCGSGFGFRWRDWNHRPRTIANILNGRRLTRMESPRSPVRLRGEGCDVYGERLSRCSSRTHHRRD